MKDKLDLGAIMVAALASDVDKQSLLGGSDGVWDGQPGGVQHLDALIERRARILLVGEYSRDDANDQIDARAGCQRQFQVRNRRRIKASRQDPDLMRLSQKSGGRTPSPSSIESYVAMPLGAVS